MSGSVGAWAIHESADIASELQAETAFALAKLPWAIGKDRPRVLTQSPVARRRSSICARWRSGRGRWEKTTPTSLARSTTWATPCRARESTKRRRSSICGRWQSDSGCLGRDHPHVANSHDNLGIDLRSQGRYLDAEEQHRNALAIRRKALGSGHPDVASSHTNLGNALHVQGKCKEAEEEHRRALAINKEALADGHSDVASSHTNLGNALHAQDKYKEAEEHHGRALAIEQKALGDEHPNVAMSHENLADSLGKQGRLTEALAHYERAWAIREHADLPPEHRGAYAFELAKLLWQLGKQRPRARELALRAREAYREAGDHHAEARKEVDEWLRKHGSDR